MKRPARKPPSQRGNRVARQEVAEFDPNEISYVAMHEAGHAVASIVYGIPLESVDVHQHYLNGQTHRGYTKSPILQSDVRLKGEAIMPWVIQMIAGGAAELQVNPFCVDFQTHAADREQAMHLIVLAFCEGSREGDKGVIRQEDIDRNEPVMRDFLGRATDASIRFVQTYQDAIRAVADALIERRKLYGPEVQAIVQANPPQPE